MPEHAPQSDLHLQQPGAEIELVIDYEPAVHGTAATLYGRLKDEVVKACGCVGVDGARVGMARADVDARGLPNGRIRIPVRFDRARADDPRIDAIGHRLASPALGVAAVVRAGTARDRRPDSGERAGPPGRSTELSPGPAPRVGTGDLVTRRFGRAQ